MSPGSTMIRVYDDLKARIMAGDFAPGSRLDPMRLRRELGSSATPIRDALHRLTGERLIESGRNEGFRVPQVSEPAIRDLFDWSHDVTHIVMRAASRNSTPAWHGETSDYPGHLRHLLAYAAARSHSFEYAHAVASLSDRSLLLWRAEASVLIDPERDVFDIETALRQESWNDALKMLDHLYRKRLRSVSAIADWLHTRRREYTGNVF